MRISDWSSDVCSSDLKGYNLGLARYAQDYSWTLNAYETRIDDLISYDSSIFLPNNIDQARIRGVELTVDTTLAGWDLSAQLSHTDPRNRTRYNPDGSDRSEEHTSELQSLMRLSYAVFCLKKNTN